MSTGSGARDVRVCASPWRLLCAPAESLSSTRCRPDRDRGRPRIQARRAVRAPRILSEAASAGDGEQERACVTVEESQIADDLQRLRRGGHGDVHRLPDRGGEVCVRTARLERACGQVVPEAHAAHDRQEFRSVPGVDNPDHPCGDLGRGRGIRAQRGPGVPPARRDGVRRRQPWTCGSTPRGRRPRHPWQGARGTSRPSGTNDSCGRRVRGRPTRPDLAGPSGHQSDGVHEPVRGVGESTTRVGPRAVHGMRLEAPGHRPGTTARTPGRQGARDARRSGGSSESDAELWGEPLGQIAPRRPGAKPPRRRLDHRGSAYRRT